MIKHTVNILILLAFTASLSFAQKVEVNTVIPKEIGAGKRFNINVFIEKDDIESFARLQLNLPHGFTATEKISNNGVFIAGNDKVAIFWLELPDEEQFTVTVQIDVAPNMQGFYVISGLFSFIEDDINKSLEIYPHVITVKPKGMESEGFNVLTPFTQDTLNVESISSIRQEPYLSADNEVIVNILVNKGNLNKFGKIEEQIPPGYTPESIISKNSIFVYNNKTRTVKFMWMNLPDEPQFVVSYKLIPNEEIPERVLTILGTFTYAEDRESKTTDIVEKNIDLDQK